MYWYFGFYVDLYRDVDYAPLAPLAHPAPARDRTAEKWKVNPDQLPSTYG